MKHPHAVHVATLPDKPVDGKWTYTTERRDVRVLAVVDGYAMVRRPRCMPYVCPAKELIFQ